MSITKYPNNRIRRKQKIKHDISRKSQHQALIKVFKSNKYTYAMALDLNGKILTQFSSKGLDGTKMETARQVGKQIGGFLKNKGLEKVFFDRNGYLYHGRVKEVAEGARESGLNF